MLKLEVSIPTPPVESVVPCVFPEPTYYKINKNTKIKNLIGDKGYVSEKIKVFLKKKHDVNYYYSTKKKHQHV